MTTDATPTATGEPDATDDDALSPAATESWIRQLAPERLGHARVRSVRRISRGVSRETWSVDLVGADGVDDRVVLRRDLRGGSIDASTLHQEYEIYRRLQGTSVPVVGVLGYDEDPARCPNGRPAYLREHVEGHWLPDHWDDPDESWDQARIAAAREHVEALAAVHSLDWRRLGFDEVLPVPDDPARSALLLIERHARYAADAELVAHPGVTLGIERLRRTAPTARQCCLLKGTNGLGEEVFRDGHLVAMSDWELAAIGDPAYDIAQMQGFADRIVRHGEVRWSLDHVLGYYAELTGTVIDRAAVKWYRAFYGLVMYAFAARAARALALGRDHHARLAWVATEMQHHAQARLATLSRLDPPTPTDGGR